jgi:hypothetical protein
MNNISVYYCKASESPGSSHRLSPAPTISISPEIYYANDNVIGYTYTITLNGYANALRLDLDPGSTDFGLEPTVEHIGHIREVFNTNGGTLYIKDGSRNIIVAKGATIKNIQFDTSENRWVNYAPYTVEVEFNEVDFIGCSNNSAVACNSSFFHSPHQSAAVTADNLVDIKKHKIKEFSDKWSFTVENEIYDNYNGFLNSFFNVSYTISATGKNYYVGDNLVPAWHQAKLFVQERLQKQVLGLLNGVLQITPVNIDACAASGDISSLHNVDTSAPRAGGLLQNLNTLRDGVTRTFDIYNEQISCDTSEAEGTFSVTYNALVKRSDPALSPSANAAIFTYNKNITVTDDDGLNATINLQGTVQGLVRGGFIYYNNDYVLPSTGTIVINVDSAETKYSNAVAYFNAKIGTATDLLQPFKASLNITKRQLLLKGPDGYPSPSSFTLEHSYHDGSIGITAVYDKSQTENADRGYYTLSIVRNDPVELIQEFVIPGRTQGPLIQRLNALTSKTIAINIEGADRSNKICNTINNLDLCSLYPAFNIPNYTQLLQDNDMWIKTKEDYTMNIVDGSFSIALEYTSKG